MEYCYTREFSQKHKIFTLGGIPLPFAPNGLNVESLVVFVGIVGVVIIIAVISFVKKISFIQNIFSSAYLIITFFIAVFVWFLFSLTWDNKNFFGFLSGRFRYLNSVNRRVEHEEPVFCYKEKVTYQRSIRRYR